MSRIISGTRGVGADACRGIARAFNLPPEQVFRRAGLLPSLPAQVAEEQEAIGLLRSLAPAMRAVALKLLRALAGPGQASHQTLADQRTAYDKDDDLLRQQVVEEFEQLPPEWQHVALEEIHRLQRYRTMPRVLGDEEQPDEPGPAP